MRSVRGLHRAIWVVLPLGLATPAAAQSDFVMSPVQFPSSFSVNAISQIGKVYDDPSALERSAQLLPESGGQRDIALTFRPSAERRKANLAAFVRKTRAVDPQGAAKLQALFGSRDIISDIDRELRAKAGLRTNDLAAAYAVWWMNAWQAAHGDFSDPDRATAQAVRQQAAAALSASPALGGAGDAAKQELAESLLVQAALVGSSAAEHSNDPAMLAKIRAAVRKGARGMGLDLDAMTLTPEGFRPAGRKVGALNEAARPSSTTAGSGVLMGAALAGLGFGGLWLVRGKKVGG